jgi:uncharacterized protein YdaU (DUF1376 family)
MMHYFKRNIGDYHKKAGRLSMLEHGSYTLIMDACYDRERFPTLEEAIDWCWARTDEEIAAVKFVLSKFFTLIDGVYTQERIADEIAAYQEKAEKNKQIAIDRENNRKTKRAPDVHEACTDRHLTINQEPLTNNQEDQHNTHNASEADLVSEPGQIEEPAPIEEPRLPVDPKAPVEMTLDWEPDTKLLKNYALRMTLPVAIFTPEATASFVCHYTASGRMETQEAWVSLLVKWVKGDQNKASNVRQFPKRETQSRHTGFDNRDYKAGTKENANGTFRI